MRLKLEFGKITEKINMNVIYEEFKDLPELQTTDEDLALLDAIFKGLTEPERRILLLYAHYSSLSKTGAVLGVSATAVFEKIKAIRIKIKELLK